MSLDVSLKREVWVSYDKGKTYNVNNELLYTDNITHNLIFMAKEAGLYEALWRPYRLAKDFSDSNYESDSTSGTDVFAKDIVKVVERGLEDLEARPDYFEQFNSEDGWGTYEQFLEFVIYYLDALKGNLEATVSVER